VDIIAKLARIMNKDASETFDQLTDSLEAIRDYLSTITGDIQGGFYYGVVTAVPGANQFTIDGLAGYGETCFVGWDAYVFWDAGGAGAAPQHETQTVTAYTNLGVFTTAAYTAPVGIGDIMIIIHPNLADIINDLSVPAADVGTNILERDVIGNKTDTALYAAVANASLMRYVKALITAGIAVPGAVSDAGPAIADFDTDLTEATDDHYNGMLLMFISGANAGQAHAINDYAGGAKNVAFSAEDIWTDVPANGDDFVILPGTGSMAKAIYTRIGAPAGASIAADLVTIAGYIDIEIGTIITSQGRMLFSMDFWSNPQEEIQVPAIAATLVITPTVSVADLPAGATIVRAIGMFKFRMVENTYDGANALDGATVAATSQVIQVKETAGGAYIDAINFADNQFTFTALGREGGDVFIGQLDIAGEVDDDDSYTFQWLLRKADGDFIIFNDIQMGIRIWYSV